MRIWDKVLILSLLRNYRQLTVPTDPNYLTITDPFTGRVSGKLEIEDQLTVLLPSLMVEAKFQNTPKNPGDLDFANMFSPGLMSLRFMGVSGPTGKGL